MEGGPFSSRAGRVLASNGPLHEQMLDVIRMAALKGPRHRT
jgi:hypothetical protein